MRGRPTITIRESQPATPQPPEQQDQTTQTNSTNLTLTPPDNGYTSEESVLTYYQCYIPPDIDESSAESVERENEIQARLFEKKRKILPKSTTYESLQEKQLRFQSTNVEYIPSRSTSLTVKEITDIQGNTSHIRALRESLTSPVPPPDEGSSPRPGTDDVLPSFPLKIIESACTTKEMHVKQLVQTLNLEDLNHHGLYPNPTRPLSPQTIPIIYHWRQHHNAPRNV
jgi:hypothetical protein